MAAIGGLERGPQRLAGQRLGQADGDLVALAKIAHLGAAAFAECAIGGAEAHHRLRRLVHAGEQAVGGRGIEVLQQHIVAVNHFVGDGGAQEADRRADAGIGRHYHPGHAKPVGKVGGVQRRGAAEGDQGATLGVLAKLDGVDAGGAGHRLLDHFRDREGGQRHGQLQRLADPRGERRSRLVLGQGQAAAGKSGGVDAPQRQIGVGNGGLRAAVAVAGGAGLGAGGIGADADPAQLIDARDRAAAGADLDHLDHRNAQGQAAALGEAIGARHLEQARGLRRAVVDQADLGGGAAHVEAEHAVEAALGGDAAGQNGATRRPRLDQANREADCGLQRRQATARHHHQQRAGETRLGQPGRQAGEIACHARLHIGIGAGRRQALVFANLGAHLGGQGDR